MKSEWIKNFIEQHTEFSVLKGNELRARCPLPDHSDNNPSFAINIKTGAWNCRGCANKGKTIEHLISLVLGIGIYEAQKIYEDESSTTPNDILNLCKNLRNGAVKYKHHEPKNTEIELPPKANDQSPGWRYFISQRAKKNGSSPYTKKQIKRIYRGFKCYYCDTGKFRNRIICPVINKEGTAVYQTNRATDGNPIKTLFPKREDAGLLGANYLGEHLEQTSPIIVEGLFSAFRLYANGHEVISPLTCQLNKEQIRSIVNRYKSITLCFDNDSITDRRKAKPGIENMRKIYVILRDLIDTNIIILPEDRDPDDLSKEEFDDLERIQLTSGEFSSLKYHLKYIKS